MNSARFLTSAYVFALSLIAAASMCAYLMMATLIKTQEANATLINVAGRQRRLSQQIALNSLRLSESRGPQDKALCRDRLAEAISTMSESHTALSTGSHNLGLPGKLSKPVKSLYFEGPTNVDSLVKTYLDHAGKILNKPIVLRDDPDLDYILTVGPASLVDSLDTLVGQYEKDSEEEIKTIQHAELATLLGTLLLLCAEAALIFRPMSKKITRQMQELIDSQKELKAIFNTVGEALLTMDGQSSIVTANDQVQILWGHGKSELIGKSLEELFCKDSGPIKMTDSEIYGKRMETTCVAKDGRQFPVELVITKTALSDRELFTLSARDISELKRAEKQVSEFYSVVSHELRTPLTAIRGALGLMEGGIVGELTDETKEFVSLARVETDRMTRLVNDILDLRKIAAGRLDLRLAPCNLSQLLHENLDSLSPLLRSENLTLIRDIQPDCKTQADRDRLSQIIQNLVSNAIKFSPANGTVKVSLCDDKSETISGYRISVTDYGPGIPEDKQKQLFSMFYQVDSSDNRAKGGTGLGLAISKALVEQHGGKIGLESKVGMGSEFWFELPIISTVAPEPQLNA